MNGQRRPGRHHGVRGVSRAGLILLIVAAACMAGLAMVPPPADAAVSGQQLWYRVYNGPGNAADTPSALAVSPTGKYLYVVGDVTPTGSSNSDIGIVKYKAGGTRVWKRTWGGAAHDVDRAFAVVCDANGNVYVAGSTKKASGTDFVLIKYSSSGVRRWVRTWDGPSHGNDSAVALAVDADRNVYAAGYAYVAATGTDAALVKWTQAGKRAWAKTYPSAGADTFDCVVVDKARRRVFAAGGDGTASTRNWLVVRHNLGGKRVWASSVGDPGTYFQTASMALTPGGAVIVGGSSDDGATIASSDGRLGRWTAAGTYVWGTCYLGDGSGYDAIEDVAVDREGNVAAVGMTRRSGGDYDGFVVTYRSDTSLRGNIYVGNAFSDGLTEVAFDRYGNIYTAGKLGASVSSSKFWTLKFSRGLALRWQKTKKLNSLASPDRATDLIVRGGAYPGVYVTGMAYTAGGSWNWLTLKYKP